jgi:hypothetical protein
MVAIAPGNVQMMDVEQLDAAYQAGQINDNTMVWTQGMDAWLPLAQVIGGDDSAAEAPAVEAPAAAPAPVAAPMMQAPVAVAPMAFQAPAAIPQQATAQQEFAQQQFAQQQFVQQQVDATARAWQQQADVAAATAFAAQAMPQHAAGMPQAFAPQAFAPQTANFAPVTASGFPPVAQPSFRAPVSASGFPQAMNAFPPAAAPVPSTVPVAMNLDSLDLGSLDMPKKKSKFGLVALAALVLGAGGVTAMNLGGGKDSEKPQAAAAAALHVAEGEKPITANDPNAPLNVGTGYTVTDAEKNAFAKEAEKDSEMRDKMAAALTGPNGEKADTSGKGNAASAKAAASAMKAKFGGGGGGGKKGSDKGVGKGGSSFDPLNGDL